MAHGGIEKQIYLVFLCFPRLVVLYFIYEVGPSVRVHTCYMPSSNVCHLFLQVSQTADTGSIPSCCYTLTLSSQSPLREATNDPPVAQLLPPLNASIQQEVIKRPMPSLFQENGGNARPSFGGWRVAWKGRWLMQLVSEISTPRKSLWLSGDLWTCWVQKEPISTPQHHIRQMYLPARPQPVSSFDLHIKWHPDLCTQPPCLPSEPAVNLAQKHSQ